MTMFEMNEIAPDFRAGSSGFPSGTAAPGAAKLAPSMAAHPPPPGGRPVGQGTAPGYASVDKGDGVPVAEAVGGEDRLHGVPRHGRIGGHRHDRRAVAVGLGVVVADDGRGDVHPALAEHRPDLSDHPGLVAVAEHREVGLELEVEALAPDLEEVRAMAPAEGRAGDALALLTRDDGDPDEVGEV